MIPILVTSYTSILSPVQEFANVLNLQYGIYNNVYLFEVHRLTCDTSLVLENH